MLAGRLGALGICVLCLTGCAARPMWAGKATLTPTWERVRQAAVNAATDPQTWAPLAAGALIHLGGADEAISDWARDETPIFGSEPDAEEATDTALVVLGASALTTLLLTPNGCEPLDGLWHKAKAGGVEGVGFGAQWYLIRWMKDVTNRPRPDSGERVSFPSGHTYFASSLATLTRRHAEAIPLTRWQRTAIDVGTTTGTALTAWGRVEGGRHFPSDVLVGWALGNFLNIFVHDAFIGRSTVRTQVAPDRVRVGLHYDF